MYKNLFLLAAAITVVLTFTTASKSRGDFCLGSTGITKNHNEEDCDHSKTGLICYEGKCRCPEALTMGSANLPSNLNTWWNRDTKKCHGIRGSMCDTVNKKGKVICLPGARCIPDSTNNKVGTCFE